MAQLAFLDQGAKAFEHVLAIGQHVVRILGMGRIIPGTVEIVAAARRPMDLVEIDMVRLQALQAGFDRLANGPGTGAGIVAHEVHRSAGDLGSQNPGITLAGLFESAADDFLGPARCLGGVCAAPHRFRRYR